MSNAFADSPIPQKLGKHPMKHHLLNLARAAAVCVALGATILSAQAKDDPIPVAVDAGFNASEMASKAFTIADTIALKGMKRVAVPVFVVEFVTADNVTAQTSGFAAGGRASSSLYYRLLGVGEPEFQALTDALYAEFLRQLQASGLEVMPHEQVKATALYGKLAAKGRAAPIKDDRSMVLSPPGMAIYGFARGAAVGKKTGLFGVLASVGDGFSAVGDIGDTIALSTELDASLLELRLRVNFVELADNNRGFFGRLAGSANASGKVFPSIDSAMVVVQNGGQRSAWTLNHLLMLDNTAFADVREKPSTAGDVAGAVAVGLLRLALGSRDSSSSKEMEAIAEPAQYRQVLGAGLSTFTGMVATRLKSER